MIVRFCELLAACLLLFLGPLVPAHAGDDPCGSIPEQEEWRFVMVVDGSGSMGSLWADMVEAIKNQISTLPSGSELDIVLFSSETSGTRSRASLENWKRRLDDASRNDALRWVDRQRPGGQTPLFYTLQRVLLEQKAWLSEAPRLRSARVYIYTDGDDNPGFDRTGIQSDRNRITKDDAQRVFDEIAKLELDFGVRFEAKEIAIGGHQGAGFTGVDLIRAQKGERIPIPVAVSISLDNPQLPPVRNGETHADLDVSLQCPDLVAGVTVQVSATSQNGFPVAVTPASFPLAEGPRRLTIRPQAAPASLEDGFDGSLKFEYSGADPLRPVSGPAAVRFGVEAEQRIELDPNAILVRPGVVLRGKPVSLEFLRPLADATPEWRRSDGGRIDGGGDWQATTVFDTEGDTTVTLQARRGDIVSEPIQIVIPVRDIRLQVDRIGEGDLVSGDDASFEVSAIGLQPSVFEWRVDGRPLADQDGARVRAVLEQPGSVLVEARGQLDLGDGQRPFTDWVGTRLNVGVRPALHVRAPLEVSWARPLSMQVLIDGDIKRVRGSIVDASSDVVVGGIVDSVVQTKTLQGGKGEDRVADLVLPLPERSGEFLVRVEGVGGPIVKDEASITLRDPVIKVTLDDPSPVDRITVGQPRSFQLSLADEASSVIKQVAWQVMTESGSLLPVIGIDEPAAIDANGIRVSRFDVLLPDDGSVAEGQTLIIEPTLTTAGGVTLTPADGSPRWTLRASYPKMARTIVGGTGAQVGWGETVVFSIEPAERISSVEWRIEGPGGVTKRAGGVDQFEMVFDGTPGEYGIFAIVQPDIPNADPIELEASRTITVEPVEANVEFPEGRQARGEHIFTAVVTTTGSVKKASLVFTLPSEDGGTVSERRQVDLKPGSGRQMVETSSSAVGPVAVGEIGVVLEVETPAGETKRFEAGSLNHRGPQRILPFGIVSFLGLVVVLLTGWLCTGNKRSKARLCRTILDLPSEDEEYEQTSRVMGWNPWKKEFRIGLGKIPRGEDEPGLEWLGSSSLRGEVSLLPSAVVRPGGYMKPKVEISPPELVAVYDDDNAVILDPVGLPGNRLRLSFRSGKDHIPFPAILTPIWAIFSLAIVAGILRLAELWIL
ncbi:MAG: von Willebrand factor type domain [Planctomycetota bacterium]|jgi:hypothetical protein